MTTETHEVLTETERRVAFGRALAEARAAKGIDRAALAKTTRINFEFIEALETGAFDRLPGDVFARGFIRNLCKTLRVDAQPHLAQFNACFDSPALKRSVLEIEVTSTPRVDAGWRRFAAGTRVRVPVKQWRGAARIVVGIVLIALGIYGVAATNLIDRLPKMLSATPATATLPSTIQQKTVSKTVTKKAAPVVTETTEDAPSAVEAPAAAVAVQATGVGQQLELVVTEPVRIRVGLDNAEPVTQEYKPDTYNLSFSTQADLLIFDANAVKIRYNGRSLGALGVKGRVRRLSFDAASPAGDKL